MEYANLTLSCYTRVCLSSNGKKNTEFRRNFIKNIMKNKISGSYGWDVYDVFLIWVLNNKYILWPSEIYCNNAYYYLIIIKRGL